MSTKTENGSLPTLGECKQMTFLNPIVGASDSHAKTSALPENKPDFKETAQACFSELCTFLNKPQKRKDPTPYSLRMLKICLALIEDGISPEFSLKWTKSGTMRSGMFSIPSGSESHRTENAVLLLDILEDEVEQKYFLSKEQTERIVFVESDTETATDETLKSLIGGGITEALDTAAGGGRGHHTIEVIGHVRPDSVMADRNRILGGGGVSPSLMATGYKEPYRIGVNLSEILTRPAKG